MVLTKRRILFCILISLFIFLWILPVYSDGIHEAWVKSGPLDGSWKIGLNWADMQGLKFGKDIIFTYGPLYFLANNVILNINKLLFLTANIINLILWFFVLFLFSLFFTKRLKFEDLHDKIISAIVLVAIFFAALNIFIGLAEALLLLSMLLLFNLMDEEYKRSVNVLLLIIIGFFLAVISLIKFVYFVCSLSLIVVSIIIFIIAKRSYRLAVLLPSFLVFLFLIWMLTQKSAYNFWLYIKNSLLISSGYAENVQLFQKGWEAKFDILYLVLIFILWIGIFIYGIVKKNKSIIYFFLLSFSLIFLIYKQGFMRQDYFHTQEYFRFIIYLLIITILIFGKKLWKILPVFLIFFILALPFKTAYETLGVREQIANNSRNIKAAMKVILPKYESDYKDKIAEDKKLVMKDFPISEDLLKRIGPSDTVDIFPWEIFMLYIHDLKWSPRPIFQSYTAYTPELDKINAGHFNSSSAPKKIIYKVESLENRYPIFDEPAVFQEILKNYDFNYADQYGYGLLAKKEQTVKFSKEMLSDSKSTFNSKIKIPEIKDGYIFCNMDIKLSFFGKLKNLFYKGDFIFVKFNFKDKNTEPVIKRFVRENGVDGFFVSSYIGGINDLRDVFQQQYSYKDLNTVIDSIEISTNNGASYINDFNIEFYELKFPAS
ncbi:MAG: hypothetical protein M1326_07495 [Cyanobacteria bacterium]|nr:hypothetical protein [Cyanobacteriota bacterium]